jgi:hypothetical protein
LVRVGDFDADGGLDVVIGAPIAWQPEPSADVGDVLAFWSVTPLPAPPVSPSSGAWKRASPSGGRARPAQAPCGNPPRGERQEARGDRQAPRNQEPRGHQHRGAPPQRSEEPMDDLPDDLDDLLTVG